MKNIMFQSNAIGSVEKHWYKYRLLNVRPIFFSLAAALLICLGSINTYAQGKVVSVKYDRIIDSSPITHSGMSVDQILKYIDESKANQASAQDLRSLTAEVNKWSREFKARSQKAASEKAYLELMMNAGLISRKLAQESYDQLVLSRNEAQSQLEMAKIFLQSATQNLKNSEQRIKNLQSEIEPFLEPYAYLLEDALETVVPSKRKPDLIDVGELFPEGEAQPAWADLIRTRRYFVLSDGKKYARIFVPGDVGQTAYQQNYKILRHVLGWLWDSTKTEWTIDVYAYQNDLTSQTLKLNTTPHSVKIDSFPPPPSNTVPLDLKAIKEFLDKKLILEGAYLNEEGTLVLYGSKGSNEPMLEGQPIELSDLAVAYRAVFYAGQGDAYISLDPSSYPEQVNVNFGGRLADTRIGWVVLRSDMRFKTLSDGFDPVTEDNLAGKIRETLSDFKTQAERKYGNYLNKPLTQEEFTRYWFSPESERMIISTTQDKKLMKISSPRFTGQAVREDPAMGRLAANNATTPTWVKDTLAHLNLNYEQFAKIFPELRELDSVGRLLALFTWLKQQRVKTDLDSLLDIELPKCNTPRRKPQMLAGYWLEDGKLNSQNLSRLAEEWAGKRGQGNTNSNNKAFALPDKSEDIIGNILDSIDPDLPPEERARWISRVHNGEILSVAVIGGGIDLNLTKTIAKPKLLKVNETAVYQKLRRSPTGEIKVDASKTLVRAKVRPVVEITEQPRSAGIGHRISEPKPDTRLEANLSKQEVAGTDKEILTAHTTSDRVRWSRRGANNPLSEANSRIVYYGEDNTPAAFVRYDQGAKKIYKLSVSKDTLIAEKAMSPNAIDEAALIKNSLKQGETTLQTWNGLSEGTDIIAFDKLPDNQMVILKREGDLYRYTRYNEQGDVVKSLEGKAALAEMDSVSRLRVETNSTDSISFIHGTTEDNNFILAVGKKKKEVPISEIENLMNDPLRRGRNPIDELFDVPNENEHTFIIYRDALTRRPIRLGNSIRNGSSADPTQLISLFRQRYPGKRILLDDEMDIAKRNLAAINPIKRPGDVGLMIPEKSFAITDFGLIKRIKSNLAASGVVLIELPEQMRPIPNVLIVSGHNDTRLIDFLTGLGNQGLLKDKVILLNTCYADGNPNLLHDLIQRYQPKGVFLHTQKISDVALDPVLKNLGQVLQEVETKGESVHPGDLFERAVKRTLENKLLPERQRLEVLKLRRSSLQISYVKSTSHATSGE